MPRLSILALAGALGACASAPPPPPAPAPVARRPPPPRPALAPPGPLEIAVQARRAGDAVYLDVVGRAQRHPAEQPFEDPARWTIAVRAGQTALARLVNGPAEVAREACDGGGGTRFDVEVRFSVAYAIPRGATAVDVEVAAPFSAGFGRRFEGLAAAEPPPRARRQGRRGPRR